MFLLLVTHTRPYRRNVQQWYLVKFLTPEDGRSVRWKSQQRTISFHPKVSALPQPEWNSLAVSGSTASRYGPIQVMKYCV